MPEGGKGDDDGFGVESDLWVSAVLDKEGNFVKPFFPDIL